jgi:hypothetical protein
LINTFNDIEHIPLRTYNRCVMYFNLWEDSGSEVADNYIRHIPHNERLLMVEMYKDVKKRGLETVKRELIRTMPLPEEDVVNA